jgi:hypothetical protein
VLHAADKDDSCSDNDDENKGDSGNEPTISQKKILCGGDRDQQWKKTMAVVVSLMDEKAKQSADAYRIGGDNRDNGKPGSVFNYFGNTPLTFKKAVCLNGGTIVRP